MPYAKALTSDSPIHMNGHAIDQKGGKSHANLRMYLLLAIVPYHNLVASTIWFITFVLDSGPLEPPANVLPSFRGEAG